jgi:hypothetical protein
MTFLNKRKNIIIGILCAILFLLLSYPALWLSILLKNDSGCYDTFIIIDRIICKDWKYYILTCTILIPLVYFYKYKKIYLFLISLTVFTAMLFWGVFFFFAFVV